MSNKYKAEIKLYKNDLIYILARLFEINEDDVILDGAVLDEKDHVCTVMKEIEVFPDIKDEKLEYVPRDTPVNNWQYIPYNYRGPTYIPYNPTRTEAPPTLDPPYIFTTADIPNTATSDPDPLKVTYNVDTGVTNEVT